MSFQPPGEGSVHREYLHAGTGAPAITRSALVPNTVAWSAARSMVRVSGAPRAPRGGVCRVSRSTGTARVGRSRPAARTLGATSPTGPNDGPRWGSAPASTRARTGRVESLRGSVDAAEAP